MVGRLGRVDSHGCIRLAPANARVLFEMVARQRGATRIVIEGTSPRQPAPALVARRGGGAALAAAPSRAAQMRLAAQGGRQAAIPVSGLRADRMGVGTSETRTTGRAAAVPRAAPRHAAAGPADGNRHFNEWFLRR